MDLIRSLMLEIEDGKDEFPAFIDAQDDAEADAARKRDMHLRLIEEANYVELQQYAGGSWAVDRITGKGHDFLDSVRDPAIWAKTKDGAAKAGGFTLDLIGALAKGFIKKQIQDRTGIEVDL
jgi:hypothetical protein